MIRRLGPALSLCLLGLGLLARGAGAASEVPSAAPYFSRQELRGAHPRPTAGTIYHGVEHSLLVRKLAYLLATGRGHQRSDAKFIGEVALLHDWDPERQAGTPARVPATLAAIEADFAGHKPLLPGFAGRSVLRERFGWDARKLAMAKAMIQRTEFPFGAKHPSPAYAGTSPLAAYEQLLASPALSDADRRFVLTEAPLLSEYADKLSYYAGRRFSGALKAVRGLAAEISAASGKKMRAADLDTAGFMLGLGARTSFELDHELATRLGAGRLKLPSRGSIWKALPGAYQQRFQANLARFRALKGRQGK